MKLEIKEKQKSQLHNHFEIEVRFMFGDADGYETLKFKFEKSKYDNDLEFQEEVHDFIKSIKSCIELDNIHGRGGFQFLEELCEWYDLGMDDTWKDGNYKKEQIYQTYQWNRFCCNSDNKNINESCFLYEVPTYDDGWYGSYDNIEIFYYDENGFKYNVEINE